MAIGHLPNVLNEEDYRRKHHWQFAEISCCVSSWIHAPSGMIYCLSAVPSCVQVRVQEITIRNTAPQNIVVHMGVSATGWPYPTLSPRKLSLDVPAQTTRVWSSQPGRVFTALQRICFQITPSTITPSCIFITGAGLEE